MNIQNIAVSGATGWLGGELIRILVNNRIFLNSDIFPITSSEKIIEINKCKYVTKKFENIQTSQTFDYYFLESLIRCAIKKKINIYIVKNIMINLFLKEKFLDLFNTLIEDYLLLNNNKYNNFL